MSRDGALRPAPEDLGHAPDIDSFAVEPGVILLERFCALDRVQRSAVGWSVPVTDLQRTLGHAPHHRLRLEFLRMGDSDERRLRTAVRLVTDVQPVVHGWIRARDGTLLLTDPITGPPATTPLTEAESATVALALTAVLAQLHGAGVTGVAFSPEALRVFGRDVKVVGFEHLANLGTAEEDVHRLAELLELLSGGALAEMLRPTPTSAVELWERIRTRQDGASGHKIALPATPPFVGREEVIARLMEAARKARNGAAQIVFVQGESGTGRTRLLQRFQVEVDRWVDALVLTGSFKSNVPTPLGGFVEILDALARQPTTLVKAEHDAIRERIRAAAGPLLGMIASMTPALSRWLEANEAPTNLQLNERFGQHAATIAASIRALGTPRRPLLLLLDDFDVTEPGAQAVMHELLATTTAHHTLVVATTDAPPPPTPGRPYTPVVLTLGPFERGELRELLEQSMPGQVADLDGYTDLLLHASRGRPGMAWAALQEWALLDDWFLDEALGVWRLRTERINGGVVEDPYAIRWQGLPTHKQWMILVAALRAGRASVSWLVEVTSWNEAEVRSAVQAALDAALMIAEPDGGLRFVNEAVRRMIEATAEEEVRTTSHRQIADWLDRQPGSSLAQRAWHREHSRPVGRDEQLAELHVRGGQELLAIYDLGRARWHFDRALQRAAAPTIWIDALEGRADVSLLEGHTDAALDDYLQGMAYSTDPIRGLEIAAKAIQGFYRKDAPQAAYELASAALRMAGEPLPTTRLGNVIAIVTAVLGLFRRSSASTRVRDSLCRLYTYVMGTLIAERPATALIAVLRGVPHARGLDTENAAAVLALYGGVWGALGRTRRAEAVIGEAEAVANRARKPWGLGVVAHMRAQNELGAGLYVQANESLDRAVEHFRAAGDLTIATFTHAFRALYARESEPLERVLESIQEAESCSRRQGSRLGFVSVAALRTFVVARKAPETARPEALRLSELALGVPMGNADLVSTHAYLGLAFVHVGDTDRAWTHARLACERLAMNPSAPDYMRDAHVAMAATVTAIRQPTVEQQRALTTSLKALRRLGRNSPRLDAAWRLYAAQADMRHARIDSAVALLESIIERHAVHRQSWYALEAHRLLADIREAHSLAEASQHRQQAHGLAVMLGLESAPIPTTPPATPEPRQSAARPPQPVAPAATEPPPTLPTVQAEPLVRRLLPAFERALGRRAVLRVEVAPESQVECNPESLQLLVVNLVLAARDMLRDKGEIRLTVKPVRLDQAESARLPGVRSDAHLLVEVRALGPRRSDSISGFGICSEITASIGGFVDVRTEGVESLVLGAYLATRRPSADPEGATPSAATSDGEDAVVLHPDARIRQTVVSALRDLGLKAEGMDPELYVDRWASGRHILFAEAQWLQGHHKPSHVQEVTLYPRGLPIPAGASLRVPFTIGELQDLVDSLNPRPNA